MSFANFWFPCFLMGFGIAIDVIIATIARFRNNDLSMKTWSLPIAGTHFLFPAIGYYIFWGLQLWAPGLGFFLGVTGFVLVSLFVYEVFCEAADLIPIFGISEWFGDLFRISVEDARLTIAILAVSWDALWSGPAKAAQTEGWSNTEVGWSFLVAGGVVFVIAQAALAVTLWLRKQDFHDVDRLSSFILCGKYLELSVIGGFGVLSLWNGLSQTPGDLYVSILIASLIMLIAFSKYDGAIRAEIHQEAAEAIEG